MYTVIIYTCICIVIIQIHTYVCIGLSESPEAKIKFFHRCRCDVGQLGIVLLDSKVERGNVHTFTHIGLGTRHRIGSRSPCSQRTFGILKLCTKVIGYQILDIRLNRLYTQHAIYIVRRIHNVYVLHMYAYCTYFTYCNIVHTLPMCTYCTWGSWGSWGSWTQYVHIGKVCTILQ